MVFFNIVVQLPKSLVLNPLYEWFEGDTDDIADFIIHTNNNRRHITKNQQAMLYAVAYPERGKGGRGKNLPNSEGLEIHPGRIGEARLVIEYASECVDDVISGAKV